MSAPIDRRMGRSQNAGKELFEVQPVIVGGSPTDPANKVYLTREEHIEAVQYWNRLITNLRKEATESETAR
jgi:hypothetical protein